MFETQTKRILALCPGAFAIMTLDIADGWTGRILDDHYRPISGAWPETIGPLPTLAAVYDELEAAARRVAAENFNDRFIQEGMAEHSQGDGF